MDNQKYVELVNSEQFPEEIKVPLDLPFTDNRGIIQNLWLGNSGSVTLIKSIKGAKRAYHSHPSNESFSGDWHSIYILSGSFRYLQKNLDNSIQEQIFKEGEMVFTRPDVYHEVEMLEDTVFITINKICKNHENYHKSVKK